MTKWSIYKEVKHSYLVKSSKITFRLKMNVALMLLLISSTSSINIYSPSDRSTDVQIKTYCYSRLLKIYSGLLGSCPKMGRWEVITDNCKRVMQYNAIKSLFMKSQFCKKIFIWTNGYLPNTNYRLACSWKEKMERSRSSTTNKNLEINFQLKFSNFSIFPTTLFSSYWHLKVWVI